MGLLTTGPWRVGFFGGVVGCALVLPLVLGLIGIADGHRSSVALLSACSVLIGGLVLRIAVLATAIKQRPPLYGLSRWRAEHGLPLAAGSTRLAGRTEPWTGR